jgi:hypothetical protein
MEKSNCCILLDKQAFQKPIAMPLQTHLLKSVVLAFFMAACTSGRSQQMVQTPGHLLILCQKDAQFIGRPLKDLFKEIKPPIRLVLAEGGWAEVAPRFTFFFTSIQVYKNYRRQDQFPLRLTVYLKDPFKWEWEKRRGFKNQDHYLDWMKEDEETYGNLIITAIRVTGAYNACDYEPEGSLL